jgi:uncharacterized protein (TIGR02145 family)
MKKNYLFIAIILVLLSNTFGCKEDDASDSPTPTGPQPINFGTHDFGTLEDNEGNTYKTIKIGSATWMAQNLRVTKTTDGQALEAWTNSDAWKSTSNAAYFSYQGSEDNISLYGYLYNAAARNNVCPTGWHTPTSEEWENLTTAVGGRTTGGGKIKEEGTAHWASPNSGADNSSGFTGLPGGSIHLGLLLDVGRDGYWWASEPGKFYYASSSRFDIRNKNTALSDEGLAVRCVKD